MIYNLSEMFKQSLGFSKQLEINNFKYNYYDIGNVKVQKSVIDLTKTDKGIWISGTIPVGIELNCSRCLEQIDLDLDINLNEEFLVDDGFINEDAFTIDKDNHLRLHECLREYIIINIPLKPICSKKCKLMNS